MTIELSLEEKEVLSDAIRWFLVDRNIQVDVRDSENETPYESTLKNIYEKLKN